jgi:hypothetical protein
VVPPYCCTIQQLTCNPAKRGAKRGEGRGGKTRQRSATVAQSSSLRFLNFSSSRMGRLRHNIISICSQNLCRFYLTFGPLIYNYSAQKLYFHTTYMVCVKKQKVIHIRYSLEFRVSHQCNIIIKEGNCQMYTLKYTTHQYITKPQSYDDQNMFFRWKIQEWRTLKMQISLKGQWSSS